MRWMFASGIVVVAALFGSAFLAQSVAAQGCPSFPNGPYIWGGGVTAPSPQPGPPATLNPQPLCVGAPTALGVFNTGIPGVEVAAFEKWLVVSSPQIMWGSAIDLDERQPFPPPEKPVIVVIDIPAGTFYNTGLIGWRPDMARTPDGAVTIAFETDEECMFAPAWPAGPPTEVSGYPNMDIQPGGPVFGPGIACSQDSNNDGDFSDRVIVLYTWEPPPGTPSPCNPATNLCRGFTRIFSPPGSGQVDVFTRPSLSGAGTQGYLSHEHGVGDGMKENPATSPSAGFVPNVWLWDLSGLTSIPNVAAHPTRQFFAANGFPAPAVLMGGGAFPPPPPPTIAGGFRPHVAARANATQSEVLVYEQDEMLNFGMDLNGDGDQADYFLKTWSIVSPLQPCTLRLGHPKTMCGTASPFDIPITGGAPTLSVDSDFEMPEVNLTTTMDTVAGLPFLNPPPTFLQPRGTFFGDDALRMDVSFPGVVVFSRFEPPLVGQGAERENPLCLDENVGYSLPFLSINRVFPGIPGRGLYPTGSSNIMTFVTREYASNVMLDLDGSGSAERSLIREIRYNPTTGTTAPTRVVACGYGPSLETNAGFLLGPTRVSQVTAFLTPEDCVYDLSHIPGCPPSPGCTPYLIQDGTCLTTPQIFHACDIGNLNPNLCFLAAYQDGDLCDIVVRYELR